MDANDNTGFFKWLAENATWVGSSIFIFAGTVFGFLLRYGVNGVTVSSKIKAHESALSSHKNTTDRELDILRQEIGRVGLAQSAAHAAADLRFADLGNDLRNFQEKSAEKFVTREEFRITERHLTEAVISVKEAQSETADRIRDIDQKLDRRFDALDEKIFDLVKKG